MKAALLALGALSLLCGASAIAAPETTGRPVVSTGGKPLLEMVFVIDTTGSMSGLIDGAKQRIWGIVNDVLKAPSAPRVKIGLVAYRDRGDEYVTKVLPLTGDLDKVYATLMDYRAAGGGDGPEDVRRALQEGLEKTGWSPRSSRVAQILFLVGDAPPKPYDDAPDVNATAAKAIGSGIYVNAIQCGSQPGTQVVWQEIARRGEGEFFAIAQDGGVQVVETPYDKRLSELAGKMGATYVAYGGGAAGESKREEDRARQRAYESRFAAAAPAAAQAERALNKALNADAYSGDLLQSLENGSLQRAALKADDLPADLRKLSPAERDTEIDRRLAERKKLRAEILELSKKRDAYIAEERKKHAGGKETGFDAAVAKAMKRQAGERGIKW